jgi:hypothetical protein
VPSTIGQTVSVTWTGTIPPLTNASSNCTALADTPAADTHTSTINVPAGVYNSVSAQFAFKITWTPVVNSNASDEILTVVGVGSSDGGTPSEAVSGQNLAGGAYKIVACGFSNAQPQPYTGTLTITTSAPAPPPPPPPSSSLVFGPSTIADFQRVEGEPLNYIDQGGDYWISGPFGTSAQQSWIQRSTDNGAQFNLVSTTGLRPDAPPGGGDTDLTTDDQGFVYFIDLEALTNLGCSVSNDKGNTWRKNPECMQVPGVDRQWFATDNGSNHTIGAAGAADNTIFAQTNNQAVGSVIYSSPGSTGPTDAVGGFVYTSATSEPTGAAPGGCGQIKFDPVKRNLYMPDCTGNHVILSKAHVNVGQRTGLSFTTSNVPNSPGGSISGLFVDITVDKAGNVYAAWSDNNGNVYYSATTDEGATWTAPKQVNSGPAINNTFTWAAAGAAGNLAVIWLGTDMSGDPNNFPSWYNDRVGATGVKWYGYAAAIQNATSANPTITQARFTEHPSYYGQICTGGTGCAVSGGDRSMADFISVAVGNDGRIRIVYPDVSSQHHGAHLMEVRQLGGPNLGGGAAFVDAPPSSPMADPTGDAQWPHYSPTGPGANMPAYDFTQVRVSEPNANTLRVEMTLNNLSSLLPPAGKANGFWITRFQASSITDSLGTPETAEAYRIFYVGAQSAGGTAPTFFAGTGTAEDANGVSGNGCLVYPGLSGPKTCKWLFYPQEVTATGSVCGNTIVIDVPKVNGFGHPFPIKGTTLYNVTAFSGGRGADNEIVYADVDSTRSFDYTLGNISGSTPLLSVVSRKVHGSAGTFDVNLPLTGPRGIECRRPGATGDPNPNVDYKMVFTFSAPVTSCGTASSGTVSASGNTCIVNLTGLPNAQYTTVTLTGVTVPTACPAAFAGNVSATMGLLLGDTNADTAVNSADIAQTKSQSGKAVGSSNFREDVNTDGSLNSADIALVKSKSGTALP